MALAVTYIGEAKNQSSNITTRFPQYKSKGIQENESETTIHEVW